MGVVSTQGAPGAQSTVNAWPSVVHVSLPLVPIAAKDHSIQQAEQGRQRGQGTCLGRVGGAQVLISAVPLSPESLRPAVEKQGEQGAVRGKSRASMRHTGLSRGQ